MFRLPGINFLSKSGIGKEMIEWRAWIILITVDIRRMYVLLVASSLYLMTQVVLGSQLLK